MWTISKCQYPACLELALGGACTGQDLAVNKVNIGKVK